MKNLIIVGLSLMMILAGVPTFAETSNNEPGPDLNTWVLIQTHIESEDVNIVKRFYQDPQNTRREGFTYSLETAYGKEILLLKVWDLELTTKGGWNFKNVQSALHLPNEDWFLGDKGEYPDVHMELGLWGYNLVIHVKKLDNYWYQKCLKEKKRDSEKDCNKSFYDKPYNGMYISVPVMKYDK